MCVFVTYTSQVTSPLLIPVKKGDSFYDNPTVEFHPSDRTNDTSLIRQNDKMVAINSALEIDLTGQVCADSFGHRIYSGIGGQMDFIHGAALSKGASRSLPFLQQLLKERCPGLFLNSNPAPAW
jgi:acyl-CoA hydrolase